MIITSNIVGGLGNQLFQIFCTISCAMKYNQEFYFKNQKKIPQPNQYITQRYTYYDNFLTGLQNNLVECPNPNPNPNPNQNPNSDSNINNNANKIVNIQEKGFEYSELNLDLYLGSDIDTIVLNGYFQSPKYFEENYTKICDLLQIELKKNELLKKINWDSIDKNRDECIISLHFRLGDYKHKQMYHNLLPNSYYENSLKFILNDKQQNSLAQHNTVIYFCENEDIDIVNTHINKLKELFLDLTFIRANDIMENGVELEDWEQLLFMSLCTHNIIANSTFSWWGAYFNSNLTKIVCYPHLWFGPLIKEKANTNDLFPETWNKISF